MPETTEYMTLGLDRLPPIFAHCIRTENSACARPFELDGMVYATNGHIVVRVPTPEGWDIPNPEKVVKVAGRVFQGTFEQQPIPLPAIEVEDCKACGGAGVLPERQCGRCDQFGRAAARWCECPNCDGFHPCEACEGRKVIPAGDCRDCERTGVAGDRYERVEVVEGVYLARHYVGMLIRHKADVFLPTWKDPGLHGLDVSSHRNAPPLRFVIDVVEGRIMPMWPPGQPE